MSQQTFDIKEDEFVKSLNLTDDKIKEDFEKMRDIEGLPLGDVEDILELSEPPYYTAYPNPYIKDFIEYFGTPYDEETDDYTVEPFVGDVSEGKNDKLYSLHSYHTKVPYKSIEHYISHYTKEGDIVFDGFCGTGQTGVAAQILNRNAIIMDLGVSPAFISRNYNYDHNLNNIEINFNKIIKEIENEYGWMYDFDGQEINYTVWGEIRECKFCNNSFNVWETAVKGIGNDFPKTFQCPKCGSEISMKDSKVLLDDDGHRFYVPIITNVFDNKKKVFKDLNDNFDNLMNKINDISIPYWYPNVLMMFNDGIWGDRAIKQDCPGVSTVDDLYFKRSLIILSSYFDKCRKLDDKTVKNSLMFIATAALVRLTKLNRYISKYKTNVGPYSGTLYMSPFITEMNAINGLKNKFKELMRVDFPLREGNFILSTQSSTDLLNIPENSIDYIFIDPPFGWNLMYSELNFNWDSWLKVFSNNSDEAIVSKFQEKDNGDYYNLMKKSFSEFFRILKPERWITIEFHNSSAEIWNLIQKAVVSAGFIIAQVNVLDKKKGTINQAFLDNAVKNDLVINAYKPTKVFSKQFISRKGNGMEKEFLENHLNKLPVEQNVERTQEMLFSKLLAQYIQNGFEIELDASEFYTVLNENFKERNGYWFTENQISKYDLKYEKLGGIDINQSILGISDEKTAIIWLSQFLKEPKTYDEIYINFSKNLLTSEDKIPELKILLDENFVNEDKKYRLPSDLENKEKEEYRNKRLSKDFNDFLSEIKSSKKKIKEVRKESLLFGLLKLYEEKNVDEIKFIESRLNKKIIDSNEDISAIINWAKYK